MPLYEYQCSLGHVTNEFRTVALRSEPASCMICGHEAHKRIIHPPRVFGDFGGYESPASGRWVEGRRARNEDLLRTDCIPYEEGMRRDAAQRRAALDVAREAAIDDAIERTATDMDVRRD